MQKQGQSIICIKLLIHAQIQNNLSKILDHIPVLSTGYYVQAKAVQVKAQKVQRLWKLNPCFFFSNLQKPMFNREHQIIFSSGN